MEQTGRTRIIIVLLGASAALFQVIALREFMAVFSGNELDLGITLAVWLLAVGAGSASASNMKHPRALGFVVLLTGLAAQPLLSLVPLIRIAIGLEPGEIVPLSTTVMATLAVLAPLCILVGMQFPLAVRALAGKASRVYLLEATGAFLGGVLFTFLLSGRIATPALLTAMSMVSLVLGAVLLGRKSLALLIVVPLLVSFGLSRLRMAATDEKAVPVSRTESRYGAIEVFQAHGQFNVFSSGKFQFSYPDAQTDELRAHLPLTLHPAPGRVLLVGGSLGVAREVLKYPGIIVDFIELDPELVRVSLALLAPRDREALSDKRLSVLTSDARRFIKSLNGPAYDLVILNLPEPTTAGLNRLYTVEFFGEARRAMNENGMIVVALPASFGYVGKRLRTANGAIASSLRLVFRTVALSSAEYGLLAASDGAIETSAAELRKRLRERDPRMDHFHQYVLDDAFDPMAVELHRARLGTDAAHNTDIRPLAYRYNLLVWADLQRSGLLTWFVEQGGIVVLAAMAMCVAAAAAVWKRSRGVAYSVFLSGFSAMSFSVIILLAYQSAFGHVYERVALLTALFMAGSAGGAWLVRDVARPLFALRICEAAAVPLLLAVPLFFGHEALFAVVTALMGMLNGAVFGAAVHCRGGEHAGRLYGLDLAGSFLGALLTAIILVPLFGIQITLLFVVSLKLMSLIVLVSIGHEEA
ncbi:MAG: hypothetical protein AABZ15_00550 [Nitrospirota bacterium]